MKMQKSPDIREKIAVLHPETWHFMDEFFLFDIAGRPDHAGAAKISTYGFFLCLRGNASGSIDLMDYHLQPGKLLVYVPGQLVAYQSASKDLFGTSLVMTQRFVDSLALPYNFEQAISVREMPVLELKPGEFSSIQNYCNMVKGLLQQNRPFQAEALRHLTCAYAYSLGAYLYSIAETRNFSNEEILMQRFLQTVHAHYKHERKVIYYAEKLNLTAGYLSTIVRTVSGKTASEWIDNFVLLESKILLKSSNLTIQQISDELNFPSQSFFGKYFKRLTGLSPKEYRECASPF